MKISISVPKPCHEDWNAMTPAADKATGIRGRHCASCEHTVMDLTRVSDAQLIELFRRDAMPKCARFSQNQLDRVIALEERSPRLLPAAAVGAALALSAPEATAQNCLPTVGKMKAEPMLKGEVAVAPEDTPDQIIEMIEMGQPMVPLHNDGAPSGPIVTGDTVVVNAVTRLKPEDIVPREGQEIAIPIGTAASREVEVRGGRSEVHWYIDGVNAPAGAGPALPLSAIEEVQVITGGIPDAYVQGPWGPLDPSMTDSSTMITGRVVDDHGEALPFASVVLRGASYSAVTDLEGRFSLLAPLDTILVDPVVRISSVGFNTLELPLSSVPAEMPAEPCVFNERAPLTGRVADGQGRALAHRTVEVLELGLRCATDENGLFSFQVPAGEHPTLTLRTADGQGSAATVITGAMLPCCVPLNMAESNDLVLPARIDLGDAVMDTMLLHSVGIMVVEVREPSFGQQLMRPLRHIGRQLTKPFR